MLLTLCRFTIKLSTHRAWAFWFCRSVRVSQFHTAHRGVCERERETSKTINQASQVDLSAAASSAHSHTETHTIIILWPEGPRVTKNEWTKRRRRRRAEKTNCVDCKCAAVLLHAVQVVHSFISPLHTRPCMHDVSEWVSERIDSLAYKWADKWPIRAAHKVTNAIVISH